MSGYIAHIDIYVPDGDIHYIDQLDTFLTELKDMVRRSFPNIDAAVLATPEDIDQLVDNNFDTTITEMGVEVAKLSGATFTGRVYDTGFDPVTENQLVNYQYVNRRISEIIEALG